MATARIIRANVEHPLYPDIRNLVRKTSGLTDVLREALGERKSNRVRVRLCRQRLEKATSDVDLMVIGAISLRQLSKRLSGLATKLGREINPHALTPAEFARRIKEREHFINSVLETPRLFVIGSEDELSRLGQ